MIFDMIAGEVLTIASRQCIHHWHKTLHVLYILNCWKRPKTTHLIWQPLVARHHILVPVWIVNYTGIGNAAALHDQLVSSALNCTFLTPWFWKCSSCSLLELLVIILNLCPGHNSCALPFVNFYPQDLLYGSCNIIIACIKHLSWLTSNTVKGTILWSTIEWFSRKQKTVGIHSEIDRWDVSSI